MDLALVANLKERDLKAEGICIGEGRFTVERMLAAGLKALRIVSVPGMAHRLEAAASGPLPLTTLSQPEIAAIAGYPFHRGCIGVFSRPVLTPVEELTPTAEGLFLILDGVTDPVNIGGILRSAAAFGIEAVLLGARCGDPFSRRGIRASMASCFSLPLADAGDASRTVTFLRSREIRLIGTDLSPDAIPLEDFDPRRPLALVLGNEGHGLSDQWREVCDEFVMIPVSSTVDSLNVGVAAGIFLHQLAGGTRAMI